MVTWIPKFGLQHTCKKPGTEEPAFNPITEEAEWGIPELCWTGRQSGWITELMGQWEILSKQVETKWGHPTSTPGFHKYIQAQAPAQWTCTHMVNTHTHKRTWLQNGLLILSTRVPEDANLGKNRFFGWALSETEGKMVVTWLRNSMTSDIKMWY